MGLTDFKDRRKYLVTGPVMANIYLLIKVHKKNFPGRPVVSQVDDPTYNMCKELTRILNPLDESGRSFIKDSFALKDMLKNITITDDCRLFSLDIKSLYPKVPLWKALQCTRQALQADETLSKRTDWSVDDIMALLEICLETHFKTLDGYIYTQMDGTPIGKSISGPLAGIYLNCFWKRARADILVIWNQGDFELDCMLWYLNGIEPSIQFTIEKKRMGVYRFSIFMSVENLAD